MPSGPKKRYAARRRSMGRPGSVPSLDKTSASGSVVSDDGTSAGDERRLSLAGGSGERPADQTFQTEEWVRVSDFDVGTPTSVTAEARGQDKLAEWETVSRENAGNSSSAEESSGPRRKLHAVSDSDKEEEEVKIVSSRVKSGSGSSSSSSSRSSSSRSDGEPKKSDDEERSSGTVVVPSHDSHESSYVEVEEEHREDDCHGSGVSLSSPEGKERTIEPASSEEDNYELFSGVEDPASSAIEPASSEEQEEEKYRLFTDLSNVKELVSMHSGSNAVDLSSLIPAPTEEQVPESTEASELNKSSHEESLHPPERDGEGVAEDSTLIEPTTPERTSEKSFAENPYTFVRSVGNEEIVEPFPPAVEEAAPVSETQGEGEIVAKEAHDSSSIGLPEPNQEDLKELLEIAHSKEIAALGKQEEHILAQEEQELGKGIVEPQPLVEVLAATEPSKPVEEGDSKELQPEEAPLLKASASSSSVDSDTTDETKDSQPVVAEDASPLKGSSAASPLKGSSDVDNASDEVKVFHSDSSSLVDPTGKIAGSSEKHEQVRHQSKEDQPRIIGQVSSDTWGCCEPVQWLLANFRRSVNPRAIRN